MERLVKGDVVIIPFPFSDLSSAKRRPALVVAGLKGDDIILCQITSEARADEYSILLDDKDFLNGGLDKISMIRPNRLFTADASIVVYSIGRLKKTKIVEVENKIIDIIKND